VNTQTEWDLIQRCRNGSTAAFEPLVRRHEDRALATADALLGDADEAADAVQEAFVKAYRMLDRFREGNAFGPWFRAILRNHCLDRLRYPYRRDARWSEQALDNRAWSDPVGTARLEREQLSSAVREALAALSAEHRDVLVLKEMEELSYAEIAEASGVPIGTVSSRVYHARAALKKVLISRGMPLEEVR
jgi:RNA polymerase sigma-70 factor (ECF subfamily)